MGTSRYLNFFGYVDSNRMDLLHENLKASESNHTFLLMHYPAATTRFGQTTHSGYSFGELMKKFPVSAMFCGHLHRLALGIGGI